MVLTKSGLGAALLGGVLAAFHIAPGYLIPWLIARDGVSVPWPDTTAEMITLSQGLVGTMGFVVGIGVVFILGYWAGGQFELRQYYRQFLFAVGIGGLIGYVTPILLFFSYAVIVETGPLHTEQLGVTAILLTGRAVGVAIKFAVIGFAGAAFATLTSAQHSDTTPSRSIE